MKRDLLFFAKIKKMDKLYDGEPIYRYYFIDLRTDKIIGLPVSNAAEFLTEVYKRKYYTSIEEMCSDYDILYLDTDGISQVGSYTDVKHEYLSLLRLNKKHEEINEEMMKRFNKGTKTK